MFRAENSRPPPWAELAPGAGAPVHPSGPQAPLRYSLPENTCLPQASRAVSGATFLEPAGFCGSQTGPDTVRGDAERSCPRPARCAASSQGEAPAGVVSPTAAPARLHEALHQSHPALQLRQPGLLVQRAPSLGLGQALVGLGQRPVRLVVVLVLIDLHLQEAASGLAPGLAPRPAWAGRRVSTWAQAS